jgi:hypothetical protein
MVFETAQILESGVASTAPLKIYTGILGQIGDIVMFTPTVRRIKELFPQSEITFAVSNRYREAGELVAGLPYVDRLFVTELYFEKLTESVYIPWHLGWPTDLRGDDEVAEQRKHDIVMETRPRPRSPRAWEYNHLVADLAYNVGVPGPIDLRTEIRIPEETVIPQASVGKVVFHNDPFIDARKAWPWASAVEFARAFGPEEVVVLGKPGPALPGTLDLRGQTTLAQSAAIIATARCYVGIESGLIFIAGSLGVPTVGLFGTSYVPAYGAVYPQNPRARFLQAEGPLDNIPWEMVVHHVAEIVACEWESSEKP